MPLKDMATSTAAMVLIRTIGGTIGISIGQAIWSGVSLSSVLIYVLQKVTYS